MSESEPSPLPWKECGKNILGADNMVVAAVNRYEDQEFIVSMANTIEAQREVIERVYELLGITKNKSAERIFERLCSMRTALREYQVALANCVNATQHKGKDTALTASVRNGIDRCVNAISSCPDCDHCPDPEPCRQAAEMMEEPNRSNDAGTKPKAEPSQTTQVGSGTRTRLEVARIDRKRRV
jgi:hypothetical protein